LLHVPFSVLTVLVGRLERHPAHKRTCAIYTERLFKMKEENNRESANPGSYRKWPFNIPHVYCDSHNSKLIHVTSDIMTFFLLDTKVK